jgi:hypothetical protein
MGSSGPCSAAKEYRELGAARQDCRKAPASFSAAVSWIGRARMKERSDAADIAFTHIARVLLGDGPFSFTPLASLLVPLVIA